MYSKNEIYYRSKMELPSNITKSITKTIYEQKEDQSLDVKVNLLEKPNERNLFFYLNFSNYAMKCKYYDFGLRLV